MNLGFLKISNEKILLDMLEHCFDERHFDMNENGKKNNQTLIIPKISLPLANKHQIVGSLRLTPSSALNVLGFPKSSHFHWRIQGGGGTPAMPPKSPEGGQQNICPPPPKKTPYESRARRLVNKKWKKSKEILTLL